MTCLPVLALVCFRLGSELSGRPSGVGATACGMLPTETGRIGATRRCVALTAGPCADGAVETVVDSRREETAEEAEEAEEAEMEVAVTAAAAGIDTKGACEGAAGQEIEEEHSTTRQNRLANWT